MTMPAAETPKIERTRTMDLLLNIFVFCGGEHEDDLRSAYVEGRFDFVAIADAIDADFRLRQVEGNKE